MQILRNENHFEKRNRFFEYFPNKIKPGKNPSIDFSTHFFVPKYKYQPNKRCLRKQFEVTLSLNKTILITKYN